MRIYSGLTILILIGLSFASVYEDLDITPSELTNNISHLHETTFNITTNNFKYTNLYEEKPTTENVVFNILHGVTYGFIVEINTIVPVMAYGMYDLPFLIKFIVLAIALMFIGLIFRVIYGVIALVFFIREKRKSSEKFWS